MKKFAISLLLLSLSIGLSACSSDETETPEVETPGVETEKPDAEKVNYDGYSVAITEYAAHGTYSFASVAVAVTADTIISAEIDEYQYLEADKVTVVPNGDTTFVKPGDETQALASKRDNDAFYSEVMASNGATQNIVKSYEGIEAFVAGKTISELETWLSSDDAKVDSVAGSTLVDTVNYVKAVVQTAKEAKANLESDKAESTEKAKLGTADYAAHGTYSFATTSVLLVDDVIASAYLTEYQFLATEGNELVPNGDTTFANTEKETGIGSKRVNDEAYSKMMAENGGATQSLVKSYEAIEKFVVGKTIAELEAFVSAEEVDTVAGSTLDDTAGYIKSIIEAAKAAK